LGSKPKHVKGDIFEAKDKPNVPEKKKPTEAQKKAWAENIKKAQAARWGKKKEWARTITNKKKEDCSVTALFSY